MTVRLATGPVSWGVDFAEAPSNPPVGYLPEEPAPAGPMLGDVVASRRFLESCIR